ncbi:MAG: 16S rRNA methyltransferase [Anaerolineae bacterium]|nr:16S rRNA methyltransferase [Anaerolineae bacterium]
MAKKRKSASNSAANDIDKILEAVRNSPKHGQACEEVIRRVAADELPKRDSARLALKAVKNKLHQIGGAYLSDMQYAQWLTALKRTGNPPDPEELKKASLHIMRYHASTRERLTILEEFYATTLADIAPVQSVIDVACGLNPLAIPWMPLADDVTYAAYDIYDDMIAFLTGFFALTGVDGRAEARDMTQFTPPERAQLALVLKTLPCLEQIDKFIGLTLLEGLQADYVLVTFPVASLGGRHKNMRANYESHFHDLLAGKRWTFKKYEFATELAFLIDKRDDYE